jgi:hypothetical protein
MLPMGTRSSKLAGSLDILDVVGNLILQRGALRLLPVRRRRQRQGESGERPDARMRDSCAVLAEVGRGSPVLLGLVERSARR